MDQGVIFLVVLGAIWIFFATIQDLRKREVANWLNFSLIIFALGARFFYSLFYSGNFNFLYQGLFGLSIFLVLGNLFYYLKIFAGGDAKLMIALGPILPFSNAFLSNLKFFGIFLCIFFIVGSIYGLCSSFFLAFKNSDKFKREFSKQIKLNKRLFYSSFPFAILFLFLGFFEFFAVYFALVVFAFPFLYVYAKSVEEGSMIYNVEVSELTEGDWLYKDIQVGKKTIEAKWEGLSKAEIMLIRKKLKKVKIKRGIPFVPVFLISFVLLLFLYLFFPFKNYGILLGSHMFPLGLSFFSIL
jgi:Flp pilus assembly protein protease CpaA